MKNVEDVNCIASFPVVSDWIEVMDSLCLCSGGHASGIYYVYWVYAKGREEEEDGKTLERDKCHRAITCVFCQHLHLTLMFSGLLQKDLFKGKRSLEKSYFKQNYCHTRFAVFFPLPFTIMAAILQWWVAFLR